MEIPEPTLPDECAGRAAGLKAYGESMLETLDKPRHGAEPAILGEWEEYVTAVEHGLDELERQRHRNETARERCREARGALSDQVAKYATTRRDRDEREDWETPARMASVKALAAAVGWHLHNLDSRDLPERRQNALAAETAGYNLIAQRGMLPEDPPGRMRGTTEMNWQDLNDARRKADEAIDRLAGSAQLRLNALEKRVTESIRVSVERTISAETAMETMLRSHHRFGLTDCGGRQWPAPAGISPGRADTREAGRRRLPGETPPAETARSHGTTILAMTTAKDAGGENQGEIDHEVEAGPGGGGRA